MKCKGKVQKGKCRGECRKASADREPTTDANTLGGSDHVRIYPSACGKVPHVVAERGFHRWGFLRCGCVRKVFQHLIFYKNGFEH